MGEYRWLWILGLITLVSCLLMVAWLLLVPFVGEQQLFGMYNFVQWVFFPGAALIMVLAASAKGLSGYAALFVPPFCYFAVHFIMVGYMPHPPHTLAALGASLVGGAVGEVLRQRRG